MFAKQVRMWNMNPGIGLVCYIVTHLMSIANTVKQWCKEGTAVLKPIVNHLLEQLANLSKDTRKAPIVIDLESKVASQSYDVVDFNALQDPCSIHIPLNQFMAMLLTCFNKVPGMAESALEQVQLHAPLLQVRSLFTFCLYFCFHFWLVSEGHYALRADNPECFINF